MKTHFQANLFKIMIFVVSFVLIFPRCADDEFLTESFKYTSSANLVTDILGETGTECAGCTYVVPPNTPIVDGTSLGLKPGDVIGLNANTAYKGLVFRNIVGSPDNPIVIKNCGGPVRIDATGQPDGIKMQYSKYFRITGGNADNVYGIKVISGHMGISLGSLSTNFEVDHLEIINSGFAGIMAKTDPGCNEATWRENFVMENVSLHHNLISGSGGEGIYAGNSFYTGMNTSCGVKLPHEIHNIKIYSNTLKNTGWDAIQLGCATEGARVYGNIIENYGTQNEDAQNNGIQIGAGTGGLCYNNLIRNGTGHGLIVMGLGDNIIYNNIIDRAGAHGIFCDERYTPGSGFKFLHNTIINPRGDGIRLYAEIVPMNVIANNIISNPGSYLTYAYPRTPEDAFVYKLSPSVNVQLMNNFFTTATDTLHIVSLADLNYRVDSSSPVIDKGTDISSYCYIANDFYGKPRLRGTRYDIGAVESPTITAPNALPIANSGKDVTITAPINTVVLQGSATDPDGYVVSYKWTQYGGPAAILENTDAPALSVKGLTGGRYYFRLTVTDDEGATDLDNVMVTVLAPEPLPDEKPEPANLAPVANAGRDIYITLPMNKIKLTGTAVDNDGSIVSYSWSQYRGPYAQISGANTATPTVTIFSTGIYYFRLTVTDNKGSTGFDNMLIGVSSELDQTSR
jgi:hypothetical protein